MHKKRLATLSIAVLVLSILAVNTPVASGSYARLHFLLPTGSALGDNTNLLQIQIETDADNYYFNGTGETVIDVDEGENVIQVRGIATIDNNYAETPTKAKSRTRISMTLTDPDSDTIFDNYLGITEFGDSYGTVQDNTTYYTVTWREDPVTLSVDRLGIVLENGTYNFTFEYEVNAIVTE